MKVTVASAESIVTKYWGYRPVLKKGRDVIINGVTFPGEDYLVLGEVHYDENDTPVCWDGGRHFQIGAEEGVEGMISLLETAIRHLKERGVLEDPWSEEK